eukprot:TRINITY_DN1394_c0_g2_i1.p1 TRINITY_DN1394_c0_g2~~TRINITY_DN1394_c0_g2_i1.p1  ORF type:complete len:472 (+),score=148.32 TRINITY_DN1394_c0_g2_i1:174-1589(+)
MWHAAMLLAALFPLLASGALLNQPYIPSITNSWYAAEAKCRVASKGHLLSLGSEETRSLFDKIDTGKYWVGAIQQRGVWKWSNGFDFDTSLLLEDTTRERHGARCMYADWDSVSENLKLFTADCSDILPFICAAAGDTACGWRRSNLFLANANFGASGNHDVRISSRGVMNIEGIDVAIGEWSSPTRFVVVPPHSFRCNWIAEFSLGPDGKAVARTGCQTSLGEYSLNHTDMDQPQCIVRTPSPARSRGMNTFSRSAEVAAAPLDPLSLHKEGAHTAGGASDQPNSNRAEWMWSFAFVAVAGASTFAAVGASQRSMSAHAPRHADSGGDSGAEMEPRQPASTSGSDCGRAECSGKASGDDSVCDICKKFNPDIAKVRLRAVHEALQNEFRLPLTVLTTRCDHVGNDHIHVFSVENDFDASSLGALSTVYSRTKPRLPRNTRIHIEKGKRPEYSVEDETNYDPEMSAYHYGA